VKEGEEVPTKAFDMMWKRVKGNTVMFDLDEDRSIPGRCTAMCEKPTTTLVIG